MLYYSVISVILELDVLTQHAPIEMDDNIPIPIDSISTNDIDTITINTTDSETKKDWL